MEYSGFPSFDYKPNPLLCRKWGSFLALGAILVVLGTLALGSAFWTTFASVLLFGAVLAGAGIAQVVHAFWAPEWRGFFGQLLVGILGIVVGGLMIMNPLLGALSLTLLLATLFIASGLFRIATSFFGKVEHWGWLLFNGIVTLALGLFVLAQWPAGSLLDSGIIHCNRSYICWMVPY